MRPRQLALLLALVLCGAAATAAPTIRADNPSYSASINAAGAIVKHVFDITNTGNQTLEIIGILPSCTCTTVAPTSAKLAPGKSVDIAVSVDTTNFTALTERTVTVESNDPVNPELPLLISVKIAEQAATQLPTISASEFQNASISSSTCEHQRSSIRAICLAPSIFPSGSSKPTCQCGL